MFDYGVFDAVTFEDSPTSVEIVIIVQPETGGQWLPDYRKHKPPEGKMTKLPLHHSDEARKIHKAAQTMSSLGGHARAAKLSSQERVKIATKAANTRWKS